MDECVENELANETVTKESIGKQRMHVCWGAWMWVRVPGQRGGWSRGLQSGLDEGLVLWCVLLQEGAQDILADNGLSSGSEAETS